MARALRCGASARAGEKILRPLEHDAELFEVLGAQRPAAARDKDALRADHADAGNAQQRFVIRAVDLDREEVGVPQRPAALGIEQRVEVRLAFVEQLAGAKAVEPQQPIRLIESVLAQKRRLGIQRR